MTKPFSSEFIKKTNISEYVLTEDQMRKMIEKNKINLNTESDNLGKENEKNSKKIQTLEETLHETERTRNIIYEQSKNALGSEKNYYNEKLNEIETIINNQTKELLKEKNKYNSNYETINYNRREIEQQQGNTTERFLKLCENYPYINLALLEKKRKPIAIKMNTYAQENAIKIATKKNKDMLTLPQFIIQNINDSNQQYIDISISAKKLREYRSEEYYIDTKITRETNIKIPVTKVHNDIASLLKNYSQQETYEFIGSHKSIKGFDRLYISILDMVLGFGVASSIACGVYGLIKPSALAQLMGLIIPPTLTLITFKYIDEDYSPMNPWRRYNKIETKIRYVAPQLPGFIPPGIKTQIEESKEHFDEIYLIREIKPKEWQLNQTQRVHPDPDPLVVGVSKEFGTAHYITEFNATPLELKLKKEMMK